MKTLRHGRVGTYTHHGCRCSDCLAASRDYKTEVRKRQLQRRVLVDGRLVHPDVEHGRENSYTNWGCRCQPCTTANTAAVRKYRRSIREHQTTTGDTQ